MNITLAYNLGALQEQLGLDPMSRVTFEMTDTGVIVSDYSTSTMFTLTFGPPTQVLKSSFVVPQWARQIFIATDDELKRRWMETKGLNEERETIFGELRVRGVRFLDTEPGSNS
jgi:hypothetical protein